MGSPVGASDAEATPAVAKVGLRNEGDPVFPAQLVHVLCVVSTTVTAMRKWWEAVKHSGQFFSGAPDPRNPSWQLSPSLPLLVGS